MLVVFFFRILQEAVSCLGNFSLMVKSCCAINCTNRNNEEGRSKKITFHRFPADDNQRAAWIRAVQRIDPKTKREWQPTKYSVICSCHFLPEDFRLDRGVTLLKPGVVPTVFNITHEQMNEWQKLYAWILKTESKDLKVGADEAQQ